MIAQQGTRTALLRACQIGTELVRSPQRGFSLRHYHGATAAGTAPTVAARYDIDRSQNHRRRNSSLSTLDACPSAHRDLPSRKTYLEHLTRISSSDLGRRERGSLCRRKTAVLSAHF
jgi:hypothetical protein